MAMARVLSQNHKRIYAVCNLCRSFARQARTSKTGGDATKKRKSGVPAMAERCKGILGLNWRGQLTTLRPRLADKEEREKAEKTLGEFANYLVFREDVIVHIPEESQHGPNLLLNNRASFIIGHTDPSPLMKVFQQVKKTPPHVLLVGTLTVPDEADMLSPEFLKTIAEKELKDLEQTVNQSSPSIRSILESGSHVLRSRVGALKCMVESKEEDTFYRFDASSIHYIDMYGIKHLVELEVLRKAKKTLSPLLQLVIEGINRNRTRRMGLKIMCAWFLHVKVEEAFMFSGDRWGLNVLAKVLSDTDAEKRPKDGGKKPNSSEVPEWKDLRLSFKTEVNDINEICAMLGRMEKECVIALSQAKESHAKERMQSTSAEEVVEEYE